MKRWLKQNQWCITIFLGFFACLSLFVMQYQNHATQENFSKEFLISPLNEYQLSLAQAKRQSMLPSNNDNEGMFTAVSLNNIYLMQNGKIFVRKHGENTWTITPLEINEQVISMSASPKGHLWINGEKKDLWSVYIFTIKHMYAFYELANISDENTIVLPITLPE